MSGHGSLQPFAGRDFRFTHPAVFSQGALNILTTSQRTIVILFCSAWGDPLAGLRRAGASDLTGGRTGRSEIEASLAS